MDVVRRPFGEREQAAADRDQSPDRHERHIESLQSQPYRWEAQGSLCPQIYPASGAIWQP